jgi:hypothetical protein
MSLAGHQLRTRQAVDAQQAPLGANTRAKVASSPDSTGRITVIVPDWDANVPWGPVRWVLGGGAGDGSPAVGDPAVLLADDRGRAIAAIVWPAS